MKKILLALSLLCCCLLDAEAQEKKLYNYLTPEIKTTDHDSRIEVNKRGDTVLVASYKGFDVVNKINATFSKMYKGTPFFKNGWFKGKTIEKNGVQATYLMVYNQQKGVLHVMVDPLLEAIVLKPAEFTIQNHRFVLVKNQYYEPIYEGKVTILKEYQCVLRLNRNLQNTGYEASGNESEYEGEFIKSVKYFWYEGGKLSAIPAGKRFYKLFGNQAKEVELFAKDRQLVPTSERDMIEIAKYFNPL